MAMIKIDYDNKIGDLETFVNDFGARFKFLCRLYPFRLFVENISVWETKKGFHFYIEIKGNREFKDVEILYMQLLLYSDVYREGFNMVRIAEGDVGPDRWNILFVDNELKTSASRSIEAVLKLKLDSICRQ